MFRLLLLLPLPLLRPLGVSSVPQLPKEEQRGMGRSSWERPLPLRLFRRSCRWCRSVRRSLANSIFSPGWRRRQQPQCDFVAAVEEAEVEAAPEEAEDEECELPMLRYSWEWFENVGMKSSKIFAGLETLRFLRLVLKIGEVIGGSWLNEINLGDLKWWTILQIILYSLQVRQKVEWSFWLRDRQKIKRSSYKSSSLSRVQWYFKVYTIFK